MSSARPYTLRRSRRARRARLVVTLDGDAVVTLPTRAAVTVADRLVEAQDAWIERQVQRTRPARARLAARPPLGSGRVLTVAGHPVQVVVEPTRLPAARPATVRRAPRSDDPAVPEQLRVVLPLGSEDPAPAVERWLRGEARRVLGERVRQLAPALRATPGSLRIGDPRTRWGSASRRGLSFSWRLVLAPPVVIDAVVVHELAHLRIASHGREFWSLVRGHAPETDFARRWLRQHELDLRRALD